MRVSPDNHYRAVLKLETDKGAEAGAVTVSAPPTGAVLENDFVSSLGLGQAGRAVFVHAEGAQLRRTPLTGAHVTVSPPDGTTFAPVDWAVPDVPAKAADGTPGVQFKVVQARASSLAEDPQIAWKNLSTSASLNGGAPVLSHGPKVIPPGGGFETARYGDRPFPVVPVDFRDRKHAAASTASKLESKINDPANPGSTFNLYQEISYRQLFPHATIPSDGIATAPWGRPNFAFSQPATQCTAFTNTTSPLGVKQGDRIDDGWYELPGDTQYYGLDGKGSALIGAETGVGALQDIDSGCGPTGKAVYDAAQIADPEIDYDDYDTDKDGVVDFFMMVFPGLGGNGDSQLNGDPPYDNIWPHSSDLQNSYVDANGEKGYVTHDQSHDLEGRPLFWTDTSRTKKTTTDTGIPVYVRVGPYNVNPESAITYASVISHEYGHSLGLPDYYSTGSRTTYGGWTLMAEDHSQNIDVIGKKELGWLVPRVLEPGTSQTTSAAGRTPSPTPAGSTGRRPTARPTRSPARASTTARATSRTCRGGGSSTRRSCRAAATCTGRARATASAARRPRGTTSTSRSRTSPPARRSSRSASSRAGTPSGTSTTASCSAPPTTARPTRPIRRPTATRRPRTPTATTARRPMATASPARSGSYAANTQTVDRVAGNYPAATFVDDSYDISNLIGKPGAVLRFAYATDPGLARPGWFIDDLQIKADDKVIYSSDFENANDTALYNGGCREGLQTAQQCTHGWHYVPPTRTRPPSTPT